MKNPPGWRVDGLLVIVNITGEREYSYKMPFFAQTVTGLDVFRQKKTRQRVDWRVIGFV